ncbi:hypothetical protein [Streptomyces sp. NBC_00996]|uniref:hypothetical protein n=1 Tax=Streptomyces sp. NBC_00996 TaxID=2903710 RepID=UPI00386E6B0E|nr:hypothetical protein OG390_31115 [Streptomyces sp. NBC_00996]
MRRWRGFWAALYCGALGLICAIEFRDFHYMIGDFFKASVVTAVARAMVEVCGLAEPLRRRRERASQGRDAG